MKLYRLKYKRHYADYAYRSLVLSAKSIDKALGRSYTIMNKIVDSYNYYINEESIVEIRQ